MANILIDAFGLVDAFHHRMTGKGNKQLQDKIRAAQESEEFHNFITTQYSIVTAQFHLVDYFERNNINGGTQRQYTIEFRKLLEPFFTNDKQYQLHDIDDLDDMLIVGEVFQRLDDNADMEEAIIVYLATGPYYGAMVLGAPSEAYENNNIDMFQAL